jgi:hypothetical protein
MRVCPSARVEKARCAENVQMLGDGGGADVERVHQFAAGPLALGEQFHDAAAGGIGEGFESEHGARY